MNQTEAEIQSPCISVCTIDESTGFCHGCYRTMDEIQNWWEISNAEKSVVLQQLETRIAQSFD